MDFYIYVGFIGVFGVEKLHCLSDMTRRSPIDSQHRSRRVSPAVYKQCGVQRG